MAPGLAAGHHSSLISVQRKQREGHSQIRINTAHCSGGWLHSAPVRIILFIASGNDLKVEREHSAVQSNGV